MVSLRNRQPAVETTAGAKPHLVGFEEKKKHTIRFDLFLQPHAGGVSRSCRGFNRPAILAGNQICLLEPQPAVETTAGQQNPTSWGLGFRALAVVEVTTETVKEFKL